MQVPGFNFSFFVCLKSR